MHARVAVYPSGQSQLRPRASVKRIRGCKIKWPYLSHTDTQGICPFFTHSTLLKITLGRRRLAESALVRHAMTHHIRAKHDAQSRAGDQLQWKTQASRSPSGVGVPGCWFPVLDAFRGTCIDNVTTSNICNFSQEKHAYLA